VTERVAVQEFEYVERMKQWDAIGWGLQAASVSFGGRR